jgi:hypothetical protein
VHRGSAVVRSAILAMVIAAGFQLTAAGVAGATTDTPGQISVNQHKVEAGSTGNALIFSYVRGGHRLSAGTLSLKVATGWTVPQTSTLGSPGFVEANRGNVVVSKRLIKVTGLTPCKPCSLQLSYLDATAPTTVGPAIFVTKAAKPGQALGRRPRRQRPPRSRATASPSPRAAME